MYADRETFRAIARQTDPASPGADARRPDRHGAGALGADPGRLSPGGGERRGTVAGYYEAAHLRRLQTITAAMQTIPRSALRRPAEEAATTVWAIARPEVFHLLRHVRHWDSDQYRTWLRRTLAGPRC